MNIRRIISRIATILVLACLSCFPSVAEQAVMLDTCDELSQWSFSNGGEFPGAQGDITQSHTEGGNALRLSYDFSRGGLYVAAIYGGVIPAKLHAFRAEMKSTANCRMNYRIIDANGRTFEGVAQTLTENSAQVVTIPVSGEWPVAYGGDVPTSQPVLPIKQLCIMVFTAQNLPTTGALLVDNLAAVCADGDLHLATQRRAIPLVTGSISARLKKSATWLYYPETKIGEFTATVGYNGLDEGPNDVRDLRVYYHNKLALAFWGRIGLTGSTSYYTPVDLKVQTATLDGRAVWQWGNSDSRTGLQHLCRTAFDQDGITSTVYIRFRKAHDGAIVLPYYHPEGAAIYWGGTGKAGDEYGFPSPVSNASRVDYTLDDDKSLHVLLSATKPEDVRFRTGETRWSDVLRGMRSFSYMEIYPPDGKSFPAGYVNAVQLRLTWNPQEKHPSAIETCAWDDGIKLSLMQKDSAGKWAIPQASEPHYFLPGASQEIAIALDNMSEKKRRRIVLACEIRDYANRTVFKKSVPVQLGVGATQQVVLPLQLAQCGIYALTLRATEGGKVVQECVSRFTVLPSPAAVAGKDSFFGVQPIFFPGSDADMAMLRAFGMRLARLGGGCWFLDTDYLKRLQQHDIDYFLMTGGRNDESMFGAKTLGQKWEIINEPDGSWDPTKYAEEVRVTREKIKQVDPNALFLGCDVSGGDSDSDYGFTKTFLQAGGGQSISIIPFHPYSSIRIFGPGLNPVSPEDNQLLQKLQRAQALTRANNLRMWIGEIGYMNQQINRFPTKEFFPDERTFANYLVRLYLVSRCVPDVERIVWFQLSKDKTPLELHPSEMGSYSLLGVDNNVTPAMVAYANLASLTDGATFVKKLDLPVSSIYGVLQQRAGKYILALWSVKNPCSLSVRTTTPLTRISIVGEQSTLKPVNGVITVNLSDEPFYLTFSAQDTSLVEKIEQAAISILEPVKVVKFGIADAAKLALRLQNATTQPQQSRVSLAYGRNQDSWLVSLQAGEEKSILLPLGHPISGKSNMSVTLTIDTHGQRTTQRKEIVMQQAKAELIAIPATATPRIDGNLDEWKSAIPITIDSHTLVSPPDPGAWKGVQDLSATGYVMHDAQHIYFACRVKDDVQHNDESAGRIWAADSIQLGFGNMEFPDAYTEIGLGLSTKEGLITFMNAGVDQGRPVAGAKLAVQRGEGETTYEAAIPLAALKGLFLFPGATLRFAFIVNDVDAFTRKWIAVKDPALIGSSKETSAFPVLYLQP